MTRPNAEGQEAADDDAVRRGVSRRPLIEQARARLVSYLSLEVFRQVSATLPAGATDPAAQLEPRSVFVSLPAKDHKVGQAQHKRKRSGLWRTSADPGRRPAFRRFINHILEILYTEFMAACGETDRPASRTHFCELELPRVLKMLFRNCHCRERALNVCQRMCRELNMELEAVETSGLSEHRTGLRLGPLQESDSPDWRNMLALAARAARSALPSC
jgi:hypothetical protein